MAVEIIRRRDLGKPKQVTLDAEVTPSKRDELFKKLDEKGIEYKKNAKTADLEKLLEE